MASKRKTEPSKPKVPKNAHEEELIEFFRDNPLFSEIADSLLNPKEPTEAEKCEAEIRDFIDALCDPAADLGGTPEFPKKWKRFLGLNIEDTKRELLLSGIPSAKIERLIVPGWAYFDHESTDVRFRFGPPVENCEAAPVILVFRNAVWHPPVQVEAAVSRHPAIRSQISIHQDSSWRSRVAQRLTWAASLKDHGPSSQRLRNLSDAITDMLFVPALPDPAEEAWISSATDSQRFWAILAHAIDFGVHQNARRLFLDRKLLDAATQTAINDKIEKLSWFLVIEEAIRENVIKTGRVPKPVELRNLFGVKDAPGSTRELLVFKDTRFGVYGKITWGLFQNYAKQAEKIWCDHRTD